MSNLESDPKKQKDVVNRYVNDLRRLAYTQGQVLAQRSQWVFLGVAAVFLALIAIVVGGYFSLENQQTLILISAAVIGGYMALNIGANDVANNMGPAVGGKVLTIATAVIIAAVCESAGALLAGGDVVRTVAKGIITPKDFLSISDLRYLMLSALLSAALWINLATFFNAPVSTTHSIVGGILGAGLMAAGVNIVDWATMLTIAASWVISPVLGGVIAASILLFIKIKILNVDDKISAAIKWLPMLYALMAGTFMAYMAMKGLKKIWQPSTVEVVVVSLLVFSVAWFLSKPLVRKRAVVLQNTKKDIYLLFNLPLLIGVSLLCFAHGANDVANAVGPLAAIVSTLGEGGTMDAKVTIPFWVMAIGAIGIALGLLLFGPKLIRTVGQKVTRLNAPRAYCVALSSAITVLIATSLGLPVSSTHIAIGAIFGIGFLREFLENPNKQKLRPGHKLNSTAEEAFSRLGIRLKRRLVRRKFLYSIVAGWIGTVPAAAFLAAVIYFILTNLVSMGSNAQIV